MELKDYKEELEKILEGCSICRAKMCNHCMNGQRKKVLKAKIKELSPKKSSFFKKLFNL